MIFYRPLIHVTALLMLGYSLSAYSSESAIPEVSPIQDDIEVPVPIEVPAPIDIPLPVVIPAPIEIPQVARFNSFLDPLEKEIKGLTPVEAAARLIKGSARAGIFNLQALGRLYRDDHPNFNKARKRFKALEDAIGEYAKWEELLNKAKASGASEAEKLKLQNKRDAGLVALEKLLVDEEYIPRSIQKPDYITELRAFLASYAWKSPSEDRAAMIKKLKDELNTIKNAPYDFNYLEHGDGIHEFRRKLRWFPMEARALNGMVLLKPKESAACPVDIYKNLPFESIANSKYSKLVPSAVESEPLLLSPCLYMAISKAIDDVGIIKGKVESEVNAGEGEATDIAKPEYRDEAQALLDKMLETNLFDILSAELDGLELIPDAVTPELPNTPEAEIIYP